MGRKFFIVVLLVLILLGGGVFYLWFIGQKSLAKRTELAAAEQEKPFYLRDQSDQDSDGLKDWEERLWRTDPAKPDSDGDDTDDGAEIAANRHPLKPGPEDQLVAPEEKLVSLVNQALRDRTEPLAEIGPEATAAAQPNNYVLGDLKTVSENQTTLQAYAADFKTFITAMNNFQADNGVRLALEAIEQNDNSAVIKLQTMANFYQEQAKQLAQTVIPSSAAVTHLNLVNNVSALAANINNLAQIKQEPLIALQSTQDYTKKVVAVVSAITAVDTYLQQQGIKL